MEKKNVNFEDVVYFQEGPGVRNWQFRDSGIKLINIRNLVDSELCLENTTNYLEVEEVEKKYKHFLLNAGDFVMASSGVTWGKIAEVHEEHLPLCLNTSIIRLVSKDTDVLDKWYLYYYIKSPQFRRQIERLITGSAQPNFGPSHLKKVVINLPEICNQREAVEQFTKVEAVINKRQKEMELLDELIKARFVEMFGDPIINSKNLETRPLKDVLILKAGDFTAASAISDEPTEANIYPCYGGNGIRGYVAAYNQDGEYSLVGRQGALSGNVQYASGKFKNTEHALLVTPIVEMNSIWLNQLLVNLELKRYQTGAAQPGLSVKNLQDIQILCVPAEEQNQFAEFVKQVDKSKVAIQKSLDKTQQLFDALMQQYFG